MELVVLIIVVTVTGLVIGALARLAVPGPDPMPIWRTIGLGVAGSILGGVVAALLGLRTGGLVFSVFGAVAVLLAYRRWVQHRPITGPDAQRSTLVNRRDLP